MDAILDKVSVPSDLAGLSIEELEQLSGEIRALIIDSVSKNGGHLAANLGVVELTIALVRSFDLPKDKILWDVSHQTYAYKIMTGRKDRFHTLRQHGGISGFLKREESEYDVFGAGHSGTALSAALGMAVARDQRKSDEKVVAVLGDGSMGCGISFEALNNLAHTTERIIVVLNDNEMSISANVGSLSSYLGKLLASPRYNRWKSSVEGAAKRLRLGWLRRAYYKTEEAIKSFFLKSILFEEFGLRYVGPIDGHNLHALLDALTIAKDYDRPIILHVSTRKGKGYAPAERHPEKWHGSPRFDVATGEPLDKPTSQTYSTVFGKTLTTLAATDEKIVAITAAMQAGTGLKVFADRFPDRFFDVGICEEHAVVFAAGLAAEGMKPVFAVYSTFSQRAVDCMIHDVCLQKLPVILCLDRAGIVGDDGPTHHGVFDIAMLRPVPNLVFVQPVDGVELANVLFSALTWNKPVAIRYPRGSGAAMNVPEQFEQVPMGKAAVVKPVGKKDGARLVQIWALGDMVSLAVEASGLLAEQGIVAGVVNARFIRPMDTELLGEQSSEADAIVTMENGVLAGGFGSGVEAYLGESGYRGRVIKFGWPDRFVPQGKAEELMAEFGLTAEAITARVSRVLDASH
jgi:1-deoxy-D-xylulose-5-phosphate synthase